MEPSHPAIPKIAHFVWIGSALPWIYALGVKSAAMRGGFDRVVLHHSVDLREETWWPDYLGVDRVELRPLAIEALLEPIEPIGGQLLDLYAQLARPAMKSDIFRTAILFREGGVYLDTDTLTLRSVEPLLDCGLLVGRERIVYPWQVRGSRNPLTRAGARMRSTLRSFLRAVPQGYRLFARIQAAYPAAVNCAVVGARRGHPLFRELLQAMVDMPAAVRADPFSIGPHLFQKAIEAYEGDDLAVQPPEVFYPLAPEIAQHWFRPTRRPRLDRVITPRTRIVHWYASGPVKAVVAAADPDYVRRRASRELFSALALPLLS